MLKIRILFLAVILFACPLYGARRIMLVDINTADMKMFMQLPGMSKKNAKRIIGYRDKEGLYHQISDLKKVPGIDEEFYFFNWGI